MILETILFIFLGFAAGYIVSAILSNNSTDHEEWQDLLYRMTKEISDANDTIEYQRRELNELKDKLYILNKEV